MTLSLYLKILFCSVFFLKFTEVTAFHIVTTEVFAARFVILFESITTVDHKMAKFLHFSATGSLFWEKDRETDATRWKQGQRRKYT